MREPLGIAWAFKTSKPVHSDTPPPIKAILIHITTPSLTKVTNYFFTGKSSGLEKKQKTPISWNWEYQYELKTSKT